MLGSIREKTDSQITNLHFYYDLWIEFFPKATKQSNFDKNTLDLCGNADGVLNFDDIKFTDATLRFTIIEFSVQFWFNNMLLLNIFAK